MMPIVHSSSRRALVRILAVVLVFAVTDMSDGHEDHRILEDAQPPFVAGGAPGSGSGSVIEFQSSGMHLLSWLPLGSLSAGAANANDCWGYTSPSNREYAVIGTSNGTAFVEVTSPTNPVLVGFLPGPNSLWRDIKTYGSYAYAVSEGGGGIQVFDLSMIDSGTVTLANTITTGGTTATHNVAVNENSGYLYRVGGGGGVVGLRIYDLNVNPATPTLVGQWNTRYVHDAQIVTMTTGAFAGREVAFTFSESGAGGGTPGVNILDVTDKSNITQIAFFQYSSPSFSHQGWISTDEQYLYVNDELDEIDFGTPTTTRVIDISDLANPSEVGTFTNGTSAIDHNLYTMPGRIFEANYRSGLRIYDATNPVAPTEMAYFDTYPEDDQAEFNGLWSNYPYFSSGVLIGSDIEKGLFVFGMGDPELSFSFPDGLPDTVASSNQTLRVQVAITPGSSLVNNQIKFHLDTGGGYVVTDLDPTGPDEFTAVFPSNLDCGSQVRYFFSGETPNGFTWRGPATGEVAPIIGIVADSQGVEFSDDFETDMGWAVGDPTDTATFGIWTRVDPNGTAAQPENDVTPGAGTHCFVTGQGAVGGATGAEDVDGGTTTLTSPVFDASASLVTISYWRWYSNNQGASPNLDSLFVDISDDGGANWTLLEQVGPSTPESGGGWFFKQFLVSDFVSPSPNMRVRFRAGDLGDGSIVEAAIDEFNVETIDCLPPCPVADGDVNQDGNVDSRDVQAFVTALLGVPTFDQSCAGDFNANSDLDVGDVSGLIDALIGQ
ncbi:MAG: choice-of-anchor B family protein [Phycisphaerales bacterium]|nr:choice-of-anchor B family protein [Phycisphaerales bacterium]MCB9863839.1 choice-of-anchor B family protein [Phycisphaerales bacterium]